MNYIAEIDRYVPINEQETKDKEIILNYIRNNEDVLTRDNEVAHITSSGFIVNKTRDKVLMIHHNIYNSWGWTGGHADGDSNLLHVAIKEAKEETGIKHVVPVTNDICCIDILPVIAHIKRGKYVASHLHLSVAYILEANESEDKHVVPVTNDICCIDILPVIAHIKRGKYVASHLHLSVAYILEANESEDLVIKEDENSGVKWIDIKDINTCIDEEHMRSVYKKLVDKAKLYK